MSENSADSNTFLNKALNVHYPCCEISNLIHTYTLQYQGYLD